MARRPRIQDPEKAIRWLDEWLDALAERDRILPGTSRAKDLDDWCTAHQTSIIAIAASVHGEDWAENSIQPYGSVAPWWRTREPVLRVRGALADQPHVDALFEPKGPHLQAEGLHPWVWDAARHVWADGHHREAVGNAATMVETMLKTRLGRSDVSGSKLVGDAYALEPPTAGRPRLRFRQLKDRDPADEEFKSAHVGAGQFGRGCFTGIRNWAAHNVDQADEQVALEYLAALSVLARWIDECEVVR